MGPSRGHEHGTTSQAATRPVGDDQRGHRGQFARGRRRGSSAAFGRGGWSGTRQRRRASQPRRRWLVPWSLAVPRPRAVKGRRQMLRLRLAFLASACGRPLTALRWCSPRRGARGRGPYLEPAALPADALRARSSSSPDRGRFARRYGSVGRARGDRGRGPTAMTSGSADRPLSPRDRVDRARRVRRETTVGGNDRHRAVKGPAGGP
jgi:hypothetical protein